MKNSLRYLPFSARRVFLEVHSADDAASTPKIPVFGRLGNQRLHKIFLFSGDEEFSASWTLRWCDGGCRVPRQRDFKTAETMERARGRGRGRAVRKGEAIPRNVRPLKNVAIGVDAIPLSDCLSRSIEAHGRKQAPFYPVHSRQRERWTENGGRCTAARPPRACDLCSLLTLSPLTILADNRSKWESILD